MSVYSGHEAYIYSLVTVYLKYVFLNLSNYMYRISVFPGTGDIRFMSSGEDKTVRVWKGELCDCFIPIHAIYVRVCAACTHIYTHTCECTYTHTYTHTTHTNTHTNTLFLVGSSCEQTIQLPAQSVWSVHYLENGDFVVGSR